MIDFLKNNKGKYHTGDAETQEMLAFNSLILYNDQITVNSLLDNFLC